MADLKTYPVKSRIRRSGKVYAPNSDRDTIELDATEAKRLQACRCIGEALEPEGKTEPVTSEGGGDGMEFDLKAALVALIAADHDLKSIKMDDLGKLLGKNGRGVTRKKVNTALAEIASEANT